VQLSELLRDRGNLSAVGNGDIVLGLQVVQRPVDAADLAVGPALDAMPTAQALECGNRDVHRLFLRPRKTKAGAFPVSESVKRLWM